MVDQTKIDKALNLIRQKINAVEGFQEQIIKAAFSVRNADQRIATETILEVVKQELATLRAVQNLLT